MKRGFSLIELIIVITIFGILSRIVFVSISEMQNKQSLDKEMDFIRSLVQKTRLESLNSKNGNIHALVFASSSIQKIESGTTTATTYSLSNDIVLFQNNLKSVTNGSATTTLSFARISGYTNATGTLVFILQKGSTSMATETISINGLGTVE